MIAIVDYGVGNLFSLISSFKVKLSDVSSILKLSDTKLPPVEITILPTSSVESNSISSVSTSSDMKNFSVEPKGNLSPLPIPTVVSSSFEKLYLSSTTHDTNDDNKKIHVTIKVHVVKNNFFIE